MILSRTELNICNMVLLAELGLLVVQALAGVLCAGRGD